MLDQMRDPSGAPALRVRILALLVVLGMLVFTAPLVVLPFAHWVARFL